jgi:hypothetical protein
MGWKILASGGNMMTCADPEMAVLATLVAMMVTGVAQ